MYRSLNECSVCLSVFVDGEDIRQLALCKHTFHAPCIDMWLHSHSSCSLCRASVVELRPDIWELAEENDLRLGMADSRRALV
uniref:RING-type domain-containing protein n=1 Tax=Nelumbo nucifera TaxID=4432 RepID=A0A822Y3S1_NELNU|nr:TPA_asm: hypothetical protein HUJ06_027334 [Nelumbo nucifera]